MEALHISDVAIVFGNFHVSQIWQMQDKPALIIGIDILGTVASLGIDFKNQAVYISSSRGNNGQLGPMRGTLGDSTWRK
jgi:hypothetical protein